MHLELEVQIVIVIRRLSLTPYASWNWCIRLFTCLNSKLKFIVHSTTRFDFWFLFCDIWNVKCKAIAFPLIQSNSKKLWWCSMQWSVDINRTLNVIGDDAVIILRMIIHMVSLLTGWIPEWFGKHSIELQLQVVFATMSHFNWEDCNAVFASNFLEEIFQIWTKKKSNSNLFKFHRN